MNPSHNEKVLAFLRTRNLDGATITELVQALKLTRDNVRIALAALQGAEKIVMRQAGRAKLYRTQ